MLTVEQASAWLQERRGSFPPDLTAMRRGLDAAGAAPTAAGVAFRAIDANGVSAELHEPADDSAGTGALLYLHGGGFVAGCPTSHRPLASRIAAQSGRLLLLPDYRLAPEVRYPASLEDAAAAWAFLIDQGTSPRKMAVIGDSAGGGLAVALVQRLLERNEATPAALVLLSPWLDVSVSGRRAKELEARDPTITIPLLRWLGERMQSEAAASRFAPLEHAFAGFPPTLIQVGSDEVLLEDSERLASKLRAAGCAVDLEVAAGLFHVYQAFAPRLAEADAAIERIGAFLTLTLA
ncbi:alpha/beta hydrolase [Novosphingobium sp. Gsoil 351]|uniref:alpha/beta hydrolase n=1 Tax=Novosphingobium sp. Gsoil 351 TaxID=2675225 RepID=UPI0012B488F7|nr:alpha/beta hydrolase [Novosphingobium sp. Gsoil 351]QGN55498.1 alpha/beta hydrolase fold domain-containing protein [Novosphingobium sp. Gsoil 351]